MSDKPKHCEICDTPDKCLGGEYPCDLCGEFIAPVPAKVANEMLCKLRNLAP